jgi:hypothetical protein
MTVDRESCQSDEEDHLLTISKARPASFFGRRAIDFRVSDGQCNIGIGAHFMALNEFWEKYCIARDPSSELIFSSSPTHGSFTDVLLCYVPTSPSCYLY